MILRPYQEQSLRSIHDEFSRVGSSLLVLPTGTGKTVVFSHLANDWPQGKVCIVAHREELISQAADKIARITGHEPAVEMGEQFADRDGAYRVVVGSVQTLCRPKRQQSFRPEDFGLLIIDEAHHAPAKSYRQVIEHFQQNADLKLLGVTATPRRADDLALGQIFDSCAFEYAIEDAVRDGWLVPIHQKRIKVEGLDFSKCKTLAGDFSETELEQILAEEEMLHKVAKPTVDIAGDHPTLVFCVTVKHAELLAAVINRYKPESAVALSGTTNKDVRRAEVENYKSGKFQFLCNCALFLEGFDAPSTTLVVFARPTQSLTLYVQVLGRGTRPLPGIVDGLETVGERTAAIASSPKPYMMVLDFVGNSGKHKIVTAADVLGGKYGTPVREYARKILDEEPEGVNVQQALERAEPELALEKEHSSWLLEQARRKHIRAQAQYRQEEVSPFVGGNPAYGKSTAPKDPPSPGQVRFLCLLGMTEMNARSLTRKQAGFMIGKLKRERGMA